MAFRPLSPLEMNSPRHANSPLAGSSQPPRPSHLPCIDPFDENIAGWNTERLRLSWGSRETLSPTSPRDTARQTGVNSSFHKILPACAPLLTRVTLRVPASEASLQRLDSIIFDVHPRMCYYSSASPAQGVRSIEQESGHAENRGARRSIEPVGRRPRSAKSTPECTTRDQWMEAHARWCEGVADLMANISRDEEFAGIAHIRCLFHPHLPFGALIEPDEVQGVRAAVTYPKASHLMEQLCAHLPGRVADSHCDGVALRTLALNGMRYVHLLLASLLNVRYNPHEDLDKWDNKLIPETITSFPIAGSVKATVHFSPVVRSACRKWLFTGTHEDGIPSTALFPLLEKLCAESLGASRATFDTSHKHASFYNYREQRFIEEVIIASGPQKGYFITPREGS